MKNLKTLSTLLLTTILSLNLTACNWFDSVRGNGHVIKETRKVESFDGISASSGIQVFLFQGDEEKVVVEADENLQDYIVTRVEGNVLKCYVKGSIIRTTKMNVYVNFKNLNSINASSGSDVSAETIIKSDRLDMDASSGADIKVEVNAEKLKCNASSGADATITGTANEFNADASSGADIKAQELTVKMCDASASSAGNIRITVTESIIANASSGGDISYYGNATMERIHESSGGDVSKR